eukprot:GHVO01034753.1.p1 GENE.GHVO01034753.1~~GHVO01034753.1.p1  ORF type:complete len:702 (+),score=76.17 GHVO01034753.1:100-2205(+)
MHIMPYVVFQGTQPATHALFSSQLPRFSDDGWAEYFQGRKEVANEKFKSASSRASPELVQYLQYYLKAKGVTCFQAPHIAGAQIGYFSRFGMFDCVVGPTSLILYGVPKVITNMDFKSGTIQWLELSAILKYWDITREQLLEACMMAGTEYCLTLPFLNLSELHSERRHFQFSDAINTIKNDNLIRLLETLPCKEMAKYYADGYAKCRALLEFPVVMRANGAIDSVDLHQPLRKDELESDLDAAIENSCVKDESSKVTPRDFKEAVGIKLPPEIYSLMSIGVLCPTIASVLSFSMWADASHPSIDSVEYRETLVDLASYRSIMIGLMVDALGNSELQDKQIRYCRYAVNNQNMNFTEIRKAMKPQPASDYCWTFDDEAILKEKKRQKTENIDLRFCLEWHWSAAKKRQPLGRPRKSTEPSYPNINSLESIAVAVNFKLLEQLQYIDNGQPTVFGKALLDAKTSSIDDSIFALEMFKFGQIHGELLTPLPDRPFPPGIHIFRPHTNPMHQHHILLISRVASLVPTRSSSLHNWDSEIDFDLSALHCTVRVIKQCLGQLTQACCSSILLQDISQLNKLPVNFMSPMSDSMLPHFSEPRNCVGIVIKYLLECEYDESAAPEKRYTTLVSMLRQQFPRVEQPFDDISRGIGLWRDLFKIVGSFKDEIDNAAPLYEEMKKSDQYLRERMSLFALEQHPRFKGLTSA